MKRPQQSPQIEIKWVSDKTLATYFEVHRGTIWRWVREGKLSPPKKIGPNTSRFDFDACKKAIEG